MGVDYDLFWSLNPKSLQPFIKAFELQKKQDDYNAWLNGMYVQHAVASVLNGSKSKYPREPFIIAREHRLSLKEYMMQRMEDINSNILER